MPSAPGFPPERLTAQRPAAGRVAESFENVESFRTIIAAGTAFLPASQFSGRPDSIHIALIGPPVDIRIVNRGEAPGGFIQIPLNSSLELKAGGEAIEARDPGGAGAQALIVTGRYLSRSIDVRTSRQGPHREAEQLEAAAKAYQVPSSE